jgi:four helix bundle protein
MSYKNLEIWKMSERLVIQIHKMTIHDLPSFELYETGSQIRRSIKSVKANIVEGYGRKRSDKEYLQFLRIALASAIESLDHLETLYITGSLKNKSTYEELAEDLDHLGKSLRRFIAAVENNYKPLKNQYKTPNTESRTPNTVLP